LTTPEPREQPPTPPVAQPSPPTDTPADLVSEDTRPLELDSAAAPAPRNADPAAAESTVPGLSSVTHETVYVPLAVSIGDGFKFGCGFFLALVMAMLVGFVLLAILFVLTSLFGLNLPITR
jgi:hypothetical protein